MPIEIERKFLIKNNTWKKYVSQSIIINQGYLNSEPERTVRVRVHGDQGILTIKGKNNNVTRAEFEYSVPLGDAQKMLLMCEQPLIQKTRHIVTVDQHTWEIDIFEGENKGLQIAEIELQSEDEAFTRPDWLGDEVSSDSRYYNSALIAHPFATWSKSKNTI